MIQETNEERALADDLTAYVNDKHTQEECIGFIDGYKAALAKLKNLRLGVVGERKPSHKDELYAELERMKTKLNSVPDKHKGTWEREIKRIKKRLYG